MTKIGLTSLLASLCAACGGGADGSDGGPSPPASGIQITTPSFTLQPGEEAFRCFYTSVPADTDVAAVKFASTMSPGSHHFILYTTQNALYPDGTFRDCSGGLGVSNPNDPPTWVYASQDPVRQMDMPPGVAMPLKAHQPLIFDMHYLNAGTEPKTVQVVLNVDHADGQYQRAGAYVTFDTRISIPPGGTQTVSGHCAVPPDVNFFAMSTHSHKRTLTAQANRYRDGQIGDALVLTRDWQHATIASWSNPFLTLNPGEEISYACSYQNDSTNTITVGESAEANEMCMVVGYYFPADGSTFCLDSVSIRR
jgi:hypothetical protein